MFGLPALPWSAAKHCAAKGHRNWQAPTSTGSLVVVVVRVTPATQALVRQARGELAWALETRRDGMDAARHQERIMRECLELEAFSSVGLTSGAMILKSRRSAQVPIQGIDYTHGIAMGALRLHCHVLNKC